MFPRCEDIKGPVYVIYNKQCDFCSRVAKFFGKGWCNVRVVLVPNTSPKVKTLGLSYLSVHKDVHVVFATKTKRYVISKGEACFFLLSLRAKVFGYAYGILPLPFEWSYTLLKKIKRYL